MPRFLSEARSLSSVLVAALLVSLLASTAVTAPAAHSSTLADPVGEQRGQRRGGGRGAAVGRTPAASAARLEASLQRIVGTFPGRIGVWVQHIESGVGAGVDADSPYGMASTYKVPILVEMMARVEAGDWTLDDPIELLPEDQHIGSGLISALIAPGMTLSLRNLATFMIILSDNSATDMLIDRLGAEAITARMRALGFDSIRVDRTTLELINDFGGYAYEPVAEATLDEINAFRRANRPSRDEIAAAQEAFYTDLRDTTTARQMTELLVAIAEGRALTPESCEVIIDILRGTQTGANRLHGLLPPGTGLAHKTGTIGRIVNDVGIIALPGGLGRVAISVYTLADEQNSERSEAAIANLGRTAYDFFLFTAPSTR